MIIDYMVAESLCLLLLTSFQDRGSIKTSYYFFKINGKQMIKIPNKGQCVRFKSYERKLKQPFIIFAHFESILQSLNNGKQNPNIFYTNKYQKYVGCSYGYTLLVCLNNKLNRTFKLYLGVNAVYHCINSMIKTSKYYTCIMNKNCNKNL